MNEKSKQKIEPGETLFEILQFQRLLIRQKVFHLRKYNAVNERHMI